MPTNKPFRPGAPLRIFALLLCLVCAAPAPAGGACPDQDATLYLSGPAGGQIDMLYTPLQTAWRKNSPYSLTFSPVPGRGGSYALSRLLREKPAACALAALQLPSFLFLARTENRMVSEEEISTVAVFAFVPHALWVDENSAFRSVRDLVDATSPGDEDAPARPLVIAGTGSFTDQHLATLAFDRALGLKSQYIPLVGSNEAIALVKSQQAHACWGYALDPKSMPGMRALAVSDNTRSKALPNTPTFHEQNAELVSGSHFGIAMNMAVAENLRSEVASRIVLLMADPAVRKQYLAMGVAPLSLSYDDMEGFMSLRRQEAKKLLEEYRLIPTLRRQGTD